MGLLFIEKLEAYCRKPCIWYVIRFNCKIEHIVKEIHYGYEHITVHNKVFNANNASQN